MSAMSALRMLVEALFSAMPRFWPKRGIAVDVAPVDDQIVRHLRKRVLGARSRRRAS
jgi:hypothetical protein